MWIRWAGYFLLAVTLLWIILQRESMTWSSVMMGIALAATLFIQLSLLQQKQETKLSDEAKQSIEFEWQMRVEQINSQAAQTIDRLQQEMQKLQQKSIRSEEQRISYQKLMDIHQQEIEKLSQKNHALAEQLIQSTRKLSEATLSKREFDLFRAVDDTSQKLRADACD